MNDDSRETELVAGKYYVLALAERDGEVGVVPAEVDFHASPIKVYGLGAKEGAENEAPSAEEFTQAVIDDMSDCMAINSAHFYDVTKDMSMYDAYVTIMGLFQKLPPVLILNMMTTFTMNMLLDAKTDPDLVAYLEGHGSGNGATDNHPANGVN